MAYATNTTVSVSKTKAEIEDVLTRYGASNFATAMIDAKNQAGIFFRLHTKAGEALAVRITPPLPAKADFAKKIAGRGWKRGEVDCTPEEQNKLWEQACRSKWRALLLVVKARLEACDAEISTIEREFMPDIVTENGQTVGELVMRQLPALARGEPPMLMLTGTVG